MGPARYHWESVETGRRYDPEILFHFDETIAHNRKGVIPQDELILAFSSKSYRKTWIWYLIYWLWMKFIQPKYLLFFNRIRLKSRLEVSSQNRHWLTLKFSWEYRFTFCILFYYSLCKVLSLYVDSNTCNTSRNRLTIPRDIIRWIDQSNRFVISLIRAYTTEFRINKWGERPEWPKKYYIWVWV